MGLPYKLPNFTVVNEMKQEIVASRVCVARSFFARLVGLIGKSGLKSREGLIIEPCNSVHTFFMKFSIDAVFYDERHHVVAVCRALRPWRATGIYLKAKGVIELPEGMACNIERGDKLSFIKLIN